MNLNISEPIDKVITKINGWVDTFITMLPNMIVAILLFILFYIIARIVKKTSHKLLKRTSSDLVIQELISTIIYYLVFGLGLFIVLGVLKLDKAVTSLLAGLGVAGLALGFAFQDIASNFISGIILAFRKPYRSDDIVEIDGLMGKVIRTNLRVTVILTFQGQEVYIPNKDVLQNKIVNFSVTGERRIDLPVGISYGDDLEKVKNVVTSTISNLEGVKKDKDIIFDYFEFGDSSINFYIRFWIHYPDQPGFLKITNDAIMAIKKAFDENDITIPFPIRTLDFGIKGGSKLSDLNLANFHAG